MLETLDCQLLRNYSSATSSKQSNLSRSTRLSCLWFKRLHSLWITQGFSRLSTTTYFMCQRNRMGCQINHKKFIKLWIQRVCFWHQMRLFRLMTAKMMVLSWKRFWTRWVWSYQRNFTRLHRHSDTSTIMQILWSLKTNSTSLSRDSLGLSHKKTYH